MSELKATPGPYRADWDDNGQWYIEPLALTGRALRGDSSECAEAATAHLLAASWEMYQAIKRVLDIPHEPDKWHTEVLKAEAAARGANYYDEFEARFAQKRAAIREAR